MGSERWRNQSCKAAESINKQIPQGRKKRVEGEMPVHERRNKAIKRSRDSE